MLFYNLTLQRATAINDAVHGHFSGTKQQEIAISHGKSLELLQLDLKTGKLISLCAVEIFGIIRSMISFRLDGGTKDYLAIGSDSGKLVILEYNPFRNAFEKAQQEILGKSGCRRTVPGQFLAADPKGRVLIIGAMEERKVVYILKEDANVGHIASMPIESASPATFLYDMVGIDDDQENPMFACLEMNYQEADADPFGNGPRRSQQTLSFYEVDIGAKQVIITYSEQLEDRGNALIPIPGGNCGPGGVLICSENFITYKNLPQVSQSKFTQSAIRCPIPKRKLDLDYTNHGLMFICSAVHQIEFDFFVFAQTEQGDVFKITLEVTDNLVTEIKLKYMDTIAVASAMCILKTGLLFVASEFGNHYLYHILNLDGKESEPEFRSSTPMEEGETFLFFPRRLQNFVLVDEQKSLAPIMHCEVVEPINWDACRLYVACGRGPRSSIRVIQRGLGVSKIASCQVPENSKAVWAIKSKSNETFHTYIAVSSDEKILLLSIGETIGKIMNSPFLMAMNTISCALIGDELIQVHAGGIRKLKGNEPVMMMMMKTAGDWCDANNRVVTRCATNERQMVISLQGGTLVYFEVDDEDNGNLAEFTSEKHLKSEVNCLALARIRYGEERSAFLAVGLFNSTVCIISLNLNNFLEVLCERVMLNIPESLEIIRTRRSDETFDQNRSHSNFYLSIGLQSGHLITAELHENTGELYNRYLNNLGTDPVKLFKVSFRGNDAVLAVSSYSWLSYFSADEYRLRRLLCENIKYACAFCSEQCPEGILMLSGNTLKILSWECSKDDMHQLTTSLEFTPRKFVVHPESNNLIIIETDNNVYTKNTMMMRKEELIEDMIKVVDEKEKDAIIEISTAFWRENISEEIFGAPKAGPETWASVIRILNPGNQKTLCKVPLQKDQAAFSICLVNFASQTNKQFLLVGFAQGMQLNPLHCDFGIVQTYDVLDNGNTLKLLHHTHVDGIPLVICPFQGRVLIGIGKVLRLYDMGKKKLLIKCENKKFPNQIVTISCIDNFIVVGDIENSFFFVYFKSPENIFVIFADDLHRRPLTAACLLDNETVVGADRLGNISVLRVPIAVSNKICENLIESGQALRNKSLIGSPYEKIDTVANFYVGERVSSLQKAKLASNGDELLLYTTISGMIGVLICLTLHEDCYFLQRLEMSMQLQHPPLCGRDHLSFRSCYFSVKNIIDGDLCEQFHSLPPAAQCNIAKRMNLKSTELPVTEAEISKRLKIIRKVHTF